MIRRRSGRGARGSSRRTRSCASSRTIRSSSCRETSTAAGTGSCSSATRSNTPSPARSRSGRRSSRAGTRGCSDHADLLALGFEPRPEGGSRGAGALPVGAGALGVRRPRAGPVRLGGLREAALATGVGYSPCDARPFVPHRRRVARQRVCSRCSKGIPFGSPVDAAAIDAALKRRQGGYGRSKRQAIESDEVEVLARNQARQDARRPRRALGRQQGPPDRRLPRARAAAAGTRRPRRRDQVRHHERRRGRDGARVGARDRRARRRRRARREPARGRRDLRLLVRHAGSGRSRSARCAAPESRRAIRDRVGASTASIPRATPRARAVIDEARGRGDTVGGAFEVEARGVPAGLGSHVQWDSEARRPARAGAALDSGDQGGGDRGRRRRARRRSGSTSTTRSSPRAAAGVRRPTNRAGGHRGRDHERRAGRRPRRR